MDKKKQKSDYFSGVEVTKIKSSLPPKIAESNQPEEILVPESPEPELYITPGDRQKHCIEILSEGYVRSYVDFFYLTHRPDPVPELYNISSEPTEISVPARELIEIRHLLTTAEEARRCGNSQKVFACYGNLATYYEDKNDLKTCLFFNEKCLELSRITHDVITEMESCHRLGLVYDKNHDEDTAISYHEDHLRLAEEVNDRKHIVQAHETLYGLYERKAIRFEKEGNLLQALDYYKKCLISSTGASNEIWESQCNYRIGYTLNHLNRCDEAILYLVTFLNISRRLKDMKSQGQACAALAAAHQSLGQQDKAEDYLINFLELAEALKDLVAQSDACYSLGVINNKRSYFDEAVKFFTRNYELLRQLVKDKKCDVAALDNARFALGMAKGNQRIGSYVNIIMTDFKRLLEWKISRTDIIESH